jgi:hypothetical protein
MNYERLQRDQNRSEADDRLELSPEIDAELSSSAADRAGAAPRKRIRPWQVAVEQLKVVAASPRLTVATKTKAFNMTILACENAGNIAGARSLLDLMSKQGIPDSSVTRPLRTRLGAAKYDQ